jgi:hypothetical protein
VPCRWHGCRRPGGADEPDQEFIGAHRGHWTLPSPFISVCRRVRLLRV